MVKPRLIHSSLCLEPACILPSSGTCVWAAAGAAVVPTYTADARSKWITDIPGLQTASGSTSQRIPPLVHMPPPLASAVLYGKHSFKGRLVKLRGGGGFNSAGASAAVRHW
jgi:hypothetical protein